MNNQLEVISNIDIAKTGELSDLIAQAKAMQNVLDGFWGEIENQMLTRRVNKVELTQGVLTIKERKAWKVDMGLLPEDYIKVSADTTKINKAFSRGETVPGTDFKTTLYLSPSVGVRR